jgi:hypothetical protein
MPARISTDLMLLGVGPIGHYALQRCGCSLSERLRRSPSSGLLPLWHDPVDVDGDLFRRSGEPAFDALLHP